MSNKEITLRTVERDGELMTEHEITMDIMASMMAEMLRPIVSSMNEMLKNNTAAMESLSQQQAMIHDRIADLEKQIRLQTPLTGKQVSYINDAIRERSRVLLDKREIDDKKAIVKLGNAIRKAVLMRYGVSSLREVPRHEYGVALSQIDMWNDALIVRDVVKEARERAEGTAAMAGLAASADAEKALSGKAD